MARYPVLFQQWRYPQEVTHAIQSQSVAERGKKERKEALEEPLHDFRDFSEVKRFVLRTRTIMTHIFLIKMLGA